jgi:hypothetical protein
LIAHIQFRDRISGFPVFVLLQVHKLAGNTAGFGVSIISDVHSRRPQPVRSGEKRAMAGRRIAYSERGCTAFRFSRSAILRPAGSQTQFGRALQEAAARPKVRLVALDRSGGLATARGLARRRTLRSALAPRAAGALLCGLLRHRLAGRLRSRLGRLLLLRYLRHGSFSLFLFCPDVSAQKTNRQYARLLKCLSIVNRALTPRFWDRRRESPAKRTYCGFGGATSSGAGGIWICRAGGNGISGRGGGTGSAGV